MQAKLALLAKENIALDTLLEQKPESVQLSLEPIYENTKTGSSAQLERERLARNAQLKINWGKLMSETDGDRDHVWRQAMDTGRPQDSINATSQFGHRGKTDQI